MSYFDLELLCEEPDTEVETPAYLECVNYGTCDGLIAAKDVEERRCFTCYKPLCDKCWLTEDDQNFDRECRDKYRAEIADNVRLWGPDWRERLMAGAAWASHSMRAKLRGAA